MHQHPAIVQLIAHAIWAFTLASQPEKKLKIPSCIETANVIYYLLVCVKGGNPLDADVDL